MPKLIRVALAGVGAVNRALLTLFVQKEREIEEQFGLRFQLTAVADSSGAAHLPQGFDPLALHRFKAQGGRVCDLPAPATQGRSFVDLLSQTHCDLLFEGTPVNIQTGGAGLVHTRQALEQGIHVVLANKAPLLAHFHELTTLAEANSSALAFSATVCGALPVINIGQRDLVTAEIRQVRGIFNSTTNYILAQMSEGDSFAAALAEAQRRGIAEADPSLDLEGWDTANKLVIVANSVLGTPTKLSNVAVTGIHGVTTAQLRHAMAQGKTIKLIASAYLGESGYHFTVAPTLLEQSEFLGSCNGWEMGIELHTDIYGTLYHKSREETPLPTAAAMLRDAINIYR